ncbi:phosphatidylinositol-specific phospholipase C domain-containing protein, partial [Enterococcus avium]
MKFNSLKLFSIQKNILRFSFIIIILVLVTLLIGSSCSFANELDLTNWMSQLPEGIKLSQLSLAGTHNSAATHGVKIPIWGKDYGKCQLGPYDTAIRNQLNIGVRYLDIRCRYENENSFTIYHGPLYQKLSFDDILNSCNTFLSEHSRETIFMRVKQENSSESEIKFKDTFLNYVNKYPNLFWNNNGQNRQDPKLKDIRGKIVVFYDLNGLNFGLSYNGNFEIQDMYATSSADDKWQSFSNHLKRFHHTTSINYLSAQGSWNITPEDLSRDLNQRLERELDTVKYNQVGIIATDFLSENLSRKIIETNYPLPAVESLSGITLQYGQLTKYVNEPISEIDLRNTIVGLIDENGNLISDENGFNHEKEQVKINIKDENNREIPLNEVGKWKGTYTVYFSYNGAHKEMLLTIQENKTTLKTHDITIVEGDSWNPEDCFDSATDKNGEPIGFDQVTVVDASQVDTKKEGKYIVLYSYSNVQNQVTVNVKKNKATLKTHDITIVEGDSWNPEDCFDSATDK